LGEEGRGRPHCDPRVDENGYVMKGKDPLETEELEIFDDE
jgi:hypothetical protein